MRKIFIISLLMTTIVTNAQITKFNPQPAEQPANGKTIQDTKKDKNSAGTSIKAVKEKKKKQKEEKPLVLKIDKKYATGACPVVDGKIEWNKTISCPGRSAQHIYDSVINFLVSYCKEKDKDPDSQIAIVDPTKKEIGARIKEYVVFTDKALSLDRALLNYTLRINCQDGKCDVVMQSMSYRYDNHTFPAEEMLLDDNALNKTKTDFRFGGFKKFRTKTIDMKNNLFKRIEESINNKQ